MTFLEFIKLDESEKIDAYENLSSEDKFKVRLSLPHRGRGVMCNSCSHKYEDGSGCDAFPAGIPGNIVRKGEHITPYPGDNGIRYSPK